MTRTSRLECTCMRKKVSVAPLDDMQCLQRARSGMQCLKICSTDVAVRDVHLRRPVLCGAVFKVSSRLRRWKDAMQLQMCRWKVGCRANLCQWTRSMSAAGHGFSLLLHHQPQYHFQLKTDHRADITQSMLIRMYNDES